MMRDAVMGELCVGDGWKWEQTIGVLRVVGILVDGAPLFQARGL